MSPSGAQDRRFAAFPVAAGGGGVLGLPARLGGEDFHQFLAFDDFLDAGYHVLGLKRLAVVFANEAMTANAGLGSEVAGELTALVVLHHDDPLALAQDLHGLFGLERNQNLKLQMIGRDAFF